MTREWRAYHPDLPATPGARVALPAEEAHHVGRVLRLGPGDPVRIFDGRGTEWVARVESIEAGSVFVVLETVLEGPVDAPLQVAVYQGLCRRDRMEWLIQKATEIGVAAVHPLTMDRSEGRPPSPRRLDRWRRIAVESCKQSGRRRVPAIEPVADLPRLGPGLVHGMLLDAAAETPPLRIRLETLEPGPVGLAVGPEGGFGRDERDRWLAGGWRAVGLGPRTLRTETAGVIAAALILHHWADLG